MTSCSKSVGQSSSQCKCLQVQERGRLRWQHIKKVDEKEPGRLSQRQSDPSRTPTRHTHSNHQQIALAVEAGLLYTPYQKWQQIPKAFGGKRRPGSNKQAKHPVKSRRLQAAFTAAKNQIPHGNISKHLRCSFARILCTTRWQICFACRAPQPPTLSFNTPICGGAVWAKQPANDCDFYQRFTNMATKTSGDWSCLQRFAKGDFFFAAQLQP